MDHAIELGWRMAMVSDVGRVRVRNEDSAFCDENLRLAVLADGMGGHFGGSIASRLAVDTWVERMRQVANSLVDERDIRFALAEANRAVFIAASGDVALRSMGTTLVGACFRRDGMLIACNVGDSRLYRFRDDGLVCLTRDHSVLREQLDAGMIESEASGPPALRGLFTRAVGVGAIVVPDVMASHLQEGDVYLLCSDGLTEMLSDEDIADVLRALGASPQLAAKHLVDLANDRGGMDNVSVIIASSCTSGRLGAELG